MPEWRPTCPKHSGRAREEHVWKSSLSSKNHISAASAHVWSINKQNNERLGTLGDYLPPSSPTEARAAGKLWNARRARELIKDWSSVRVGRLSRSTNKRQLAADTSSVGACFSSRLVRFASGGQTTEINLSWRRCSTEPQTALLGGSNLTAYETQMICCKFGWRQHWNRLRSNWLKPEPPANDLWTVVDLGYYWMERSSESVRSLRNKLEKRWSSKISLLMPWKLPCNIMLICFIAQSCNIEFLSQSV